MMFFLPNRCRNIAINVKMDFIPVLTLEIVGYRNSHAMMNPITSPAIQILRWTDSSHGGSWHRLACMTRLFC